MGDKIDFNAALEDCKSVRDGIKSDEDFQNADSGLVMYYLNTIVQALEIATTVKQEKWISCSERMPEKNGDYLVYRRTYGFDIVPYDKDVVKDGCFPFGYWDNYRDELGYTESDWYEIDDVTHWMPLPQLPKEVTE